MKSCSTGWRPFWPAAGRANEAALQTEGQAGILEDSLKPRKNMKTAPSAPNEKSASQLIDEHIESLEGWQGKTLARMRKLILEADPEAVEEVKWRGVPVWSHGGILCTGETYKKAVKLTFAKGASLPDPEGLFNASLEGNMRRAIDIHEGEQVDAKAFKTLLQAAAALNTSKAPKAKPAGAKEKPKTAKMQKNEQGVVLLSGGNPQIAKADGDAPVQAYIAAMPGWKSALGRQLDELIVRAVPDVRKAVKWNSPFYGSTGKGYFLSFHVLTKYVKVTFFDGTSLKPEPPGFTPKSKEARWLDIYEDQPLDEKQMERWVKQAAKLPGWTP